MLISLSNTHKEHLSLLIEQPTQVVVDFCKLSIDFLQNGPNSKLYSTAAQKLSVDPDNVQNCVLGLVNLLLLSCKHKLNDADFRDSVLTLGFSQEQQAVLYKFYESKRKELTEILHKLSLNEPHYHDLDWRLEVTVASRSLLHQVTPIVALDLTLKTRKEEGVGETHERLLLQTDPNNLLHMAEELERALDESKSRHSRKLQRALNI